MNTHILRLSIGIALFAGVFTAGGVYASTKGPDVSARPVTAATAANPGMSSDKSQAVRRGMLSVDSLPSSYYLGISPMDSLAARFDAANSPVAPLSEFSLSGKDADGYGIEMPDCDAWWQRFGSPQLNTLISMAVGRNYNVRAALKRIEASRQMLRQSYSGLYPTLGLSAGYTIAKESGRESNPVAKMPTESFFRLGATMQWEVDIFGRVASKAKGSKATLNISRLEYEGVMISLAASVAQEFTAYGMTSKQLEVARHHLEQQEEVLAIVKARYKSGLVSRLDVAQAENMVYSTRLILPQLEADVSNAAMALATLCNCSADEVEGILADAKAPEIVAPDGLGLPADLLRRRPDIAEAEQQIEVLASQLGVAKKEYLPSLSVAASVGTSSHRLDGLFGSHSLSYSVAPQLSWTIFDGLSREASIAETRAEMEAEIESYNMTVANALQEVENCMANYRSAAAQLVLYDNVVKTSEEMVDLSIDRYKLGLTDFSDVSSALITLMENRTSYESARGACIDSVIALYKALGGGWSGNCTSDD